MLCCACQFVDVFVPFGDEDVAEDMKQNFGKDIPIQDSNVILSDEEEGIEWRLRLFFFDMIFCNVMSSCYLSFFVI